VRIVVVSTGADVSQLAAGTIDGFYGRRAVEQRRVREGTGWCPITSAAQQPGHIEKVLLVTQRFRRVPARRTRRARGCIARSLHLVRRADKIASRSPKSSPSPSTSICRPESSRPALLGRFE